MQIEIKKNSFLKKKCEKSVKKCFFLRKLTKISNIVNFFSEIPKMSICVGIRQGAFLSEEWKCYPSEAVSSLQFFALEMCNRTAYRKQTWSNVSVLLRKVFALEYDRFNQQKKCLGNNDDRADQMAWRNDDNTLGILKSNWEVYHVFMICS